MKKTAPPIVESLSKEGALYHLLKKERSYYQTVLEITRQENVLLNIPSNMPGWRAVSPLLKKKRDLLNCIHEIEQALVPLKTYWHSKNNRSDAISKQITQELIALNTLLEELLQLDTSNQKHMEGQLRKLKEHGTHTSS